MKNIHLNLAVAVNMIEIKLCPFFHTEGLLLKGKCNMTENLQHIYFDIFFGSCSTGFKVIPQRCSPTESCLDVLFLN